MSSPSGLLVSKQSLLLVDGDTRSLRVLEVSLRKAGFTVTPAASVADALDKLELHTPDLILSETKFPADLDGFELRRRVRAAPDWAEIPFVFLTAETAIEHKIRGLELGVDDYLTKPIYIKEIVTRINILLQKRQRAHFDERKDGVRFAGRVADMPVVDVIQTIEVSRKSGVIQFVADRSRTAAIYFRDGKVIDAEAGTLQGEDAVYRLLTWSEGEFEVVFRTVRRREVITTSSQGLLMEGMRRLDEWSRLLEQLPALSHRFEIDTEELSGRLGEVPDDNNPILRLIDGKRSLLEVIDASDFGDLECLQAISKLYFEGLLMDLDPEKRPKRDTGRPVPLVMVESPTPIEEVASGPITNGSASIVEEITPLPGEAPTEPEPDAPVFAGESEAEPLEAPPERASGPLQGSYRPSSLRLIDEAVAAAQAIDPSLFESLDAPPDPTPLARVQLKKVTIEPSRTRPSSVPPGIRDAISTMEIAVPDAAPEEIEEDDSGVPQPMDGGESDDTSRPIDGDEITQPERPAFVARRDPNGLRMTSSHGHDRAETSGEVNLGPAEPAEGDPARELITIMPRRITREIPELPVIVPPEAVAANEPVARSRPSSASLPPPPRISMAGGVARARGPGAVVITLGVIASLMAGMAIYLYVHGHVGKRPVARLDAGVVQLIASDASEIAIAPSDAAIAIVPASDAGRAPVLNDARLVAPDNRDNRDNRDNEARTQKDLANAALEEGDADKALELANKSIQLRRTAQAFLTRGRALERLDHLDQALESFNEALELAPTFPQTWQAKGMALWSARRRDEARAALEEYLKLAPDAKDAPTLRQMLDAH